MTTTVIVDDSNSLIVYSQGWVSSGVTNFNTYEYNGTVHEAASNGLKLSYEFRGTRISVYGTLDSPLVNGVATSTYMIDNSESLTTTFTGGNLQLLPDLQSHLLLYQSPIVSDGSHSLTITVSNITNGSPKYYLDFFTVDVDSPESTSQVIVDDTDLDIKYVGNWTDSHAFNEYLTSDHKVPNTGNANATYNFNGTSITVYGAIISSNDPPTQIDFYIDSELVTRYTAPLAEAIIRNVPLFSKSGLSSGSHTLLIVGTQSSQWWLDYLIYSPTSSATSSSPPVGSQDGNTKNTTPPAGPITGGIIGGVGLLLCIGILLFVLRRRRRREGELLNASTAPENPPLPTKVDVRPPNEKTILMAIALSSQSRGISTVQESRSDASGAATVSATEPTPTDQSATHHIEIGREVDGGVRLASGDSDESRRLSLLPPSYARY